MKGPCLAGDSSCQLVINGICSSSGSSWHTEGSNPTSNEVYDPPYQLKKLPTDHIYIDEKKPKQIWDRCVETNFDIWWGFLKIASEFDSFLTSVLSLQVILARVFAAEILLLDSQFRIVRGEYGDFVCLQPVTSLRLHPRPALNLCRIYQHTGTRNIHIQT